MSYPSPATRRLQRQAAEIFADDALPPAKKLIAIGKLLKDLRRIKASAIDKAVTIDKEHFKETGRNRPRRYSAVYREKRNPEPLLLPLGSQIALAEAVLRADISRKSKSIALKLQISETQVNALRTEIRKERGEIQPNPGASAIRAMAAAILRQQQQQQETKPMNTMTELQMPTDVRPIDLYAFFKEEIDKVDAPLDAIEEEDEDTEDGPMPETDGRPEARTTA